MEFLDEESRPRFLFQSRSVPQQPSSDIQDHRHQTLATIHKPTLFICLTLSSALFALCLLYFQSEPSQSLLFWLALSLLVGPFAPSSLTAGDIRVGVGPPLLPPSPPPADDPIDKKSSSNRRSKPRKSEELGFAPAAYPNGSLKSEKLEVSREPVVVEEEEEREWREGDLELLKKQMAKNPVGKPGRWEAIAEVFGGRHGVESVIRAAKSLGERKGSDADSYARFLKDRKPVDQRVNDIAEENDGRTNGENGWSNAEDRALLNALKAFPKDMPMRWDKITAAVPGRSKAACMKRVADLKRDFRSSKASAEA